MTRFLHDREFLSGRATVSQALTDTAYPVPSDASLTKGSFVITEEGQLQWSSGQEWVPLAPPGTEMMITPWVDVPEGWFEISGKLGGDFVNRRIIANLFDFGYVEGTLVSWFLPVASNMYETSAGLIQVASPPAPVGRVLDATIPRLDWVQPVSGNRPSWGQVNRTVAEEVEVIDQITFNRLGQAFQIAIPTTISGTMFVCTSVGIYALGVTILSGTYTYGRWDRHPVEEILINNKFFTNTEIEAFKNFLVEVRHRIKDNFAAMPIDLNNAWRARTDIVSFPVIDTSNVTEFGQRAVSNTQTTGAWEGCANLQTFPVIDTGSGLLFNGTWSGCISLTSFPLLDFTSAIELCWTWLGCTGLTSFPLIDTSSVVRFGWHSTSVSVRSQGTWMNCTGLTSFPLIDLSSALSLDRTWFGCSSLLSFPLLNTASVTSMKGTWAGCSAMSQNLNHPIIASFPLLNTANVIAFGNGSSTESSFGAWEGCAAFTVFPLLVTSAGTDFGRAWKGCSGLNSFPLLDVSNGTVFAGTWQGCTGLTAFPALDIGLGQIFGHRNGGNYIGAWFGCTGLTSFPLLNFASATSVVHAWSNCTGLTAFPLIVTAACQSFGFAWFGCTGLTSFPALNFSSAIGADAAQVNNANGFNGAWSGCTALTTFPANMFNASNTRAYHSAFTNCALTQTSVDNILVSINTARAAFTLVNGQIDITGGTNATPSVGTGRPAVDALRAAGWTVNVVGY